MQSILSLTRRLNPWVNTIAAIALVASVSLTVAEVFWRYVFNRSIPGSFELTGMMMAFVVFFALPYTQMLGGHIRVDVFVRRTSPKIRGTADIIALFLGMCLWAAITWGLLGWALVSWESREFAMGPLRFPYYPFKFGATVGAGIFALEFLSELIQRVNQVVRGKEIP